MTKIIEEKEEVKEEKKSARQLEIEELRRTRIPPGMPSKNMEYPAREGYVRRVVCDRQGRLEKFQKGGWRFVDQDAIKEKNLGILKASTREGVDSRVSQVVGSHKDGKPMHGYLMELPTELYEEDQAAKMEHIDALEAGLKQGADPDGKGRPGEDGRYVPRQGIKIQKGRR